MNPIKNPLLSVIRKLVCWFDRQGIEYMVFGGIANSVYGNPRQTFDIDIKIILESDIKSHDFIKTIQSIAQIRPNNPVSFFSETHVLPITVDAVPIDIVQALLPFEIDAIRRSKPFEYEGVTFNICTAEDLIIQKVVSERQKDWDDIEVLIQRQAEKLDRDYLLKHCRDLSGFMERPNIVMSIQGLLDEI